MEIGIISLFPEMFRAVTQYGVTGRAVKQGQVTLQCWNPRAFTTDKYQTVDDRPYGGGPGMVMMVEPLKQAVLQAKQQLPQAKIIYLSPQGKPLTQRLANEFAEQGQLVMVAGRYEGIDERFIERYVDVELSIGDYVLSGGELPAMVTIDAIVRQLPGVLGHEQSAEQDSFSEGLLDCPHYTRPEQHDGHDVPTVLLSGDHGAIADWRSQQALLRTAQRRPDLIDNAVVDKRLTKQQQQWLAQWFDEGLVDKQWFVSVDK